MRVRCGLEVKGAGSEWTRMCAARLGSSDTHCVSRVCRHSITLGHWGDCAPRLLRHLGCCVLTHSLSVTNALTRLAASARLNCVCVNVRVIAALVSVIAEMRSRTTASVCCMVLYLLGLGSSRCWHWLVRLFRLPLPLCV